MEHVVFLLQLVDMRRKQTICPVMIRKGLKECIYSVLRTITTVMSPAAYFRGIINLLGHSDRNVQKKVHNVTISSYTAKFLKVCDLHSSWGRVVICHLWSWKMLLEIRASLLGNHPPSGPPFSLSSFCWIS